MVRASLHYVVLRLAGARALGGMEANMNTKHGALPSIFYEFILFAVILVIAISAVSFTSHIWCDNLSGRVHRATRANILGA